MNKLYTTLLIACLAAGFTACNDDDCEDLHLGNLAHYPNVLKGTFPTESQVLELGETLEPPIYGWSMEKSILPNRPLVTK